jgi:hypothetical protein
MERGAGGATKPEWEAAGRILGKVHRASAFLIGDWHIAGVSAGFTRGDLYDEAEKITGLDRQTLYNAVNLSKCVTASSRRTDLPVGHHEAVVGFSPETQVKLLEQAATNHWTRQQLRDVAQARRYVPTIPTTPLDVQLGIELFEWVEKARPLPIFAEVVAAVDKLATSGIRTDFPKHKE